MTRYRCIYRDVRHGDDIETELIESSNPGKVLQTFIQHRRQEGWSLSEIFVKCSLEVQANETDELYHMNNYGELEKDRPCWDPLLENV